VSTAVRPYRRVAAFAGALCAGALLLSGCGLGAPSDEDAAAGPTFPTPTTESAPPVAGTEVHEVVATGLQIPWGIDFLPDGSALVTERDSGRILRVGPHRDADGLVIEEVQTLSEIDSAGEGGLLGIAVSPQYERDGLVYVYYSTDQDNRIARLTLGEAPEPILTGIPHAEIHNGGRLAFGPDGFLYAGTGDAGEPERARDETDPAGAILRITTDGEPAPGNPEEDSPVYAVGLRNVQGLAWDAEERLWATDFGADSWDELNRIEAGGDYGWPEVEGIGSDERFIDPRVVWEPAEASCSGAAVVAETLLAACLRGQRLWAMTLTNSGAVWGSPEPLLVEEYGRLRTVVPAPDGSVWIMTSNRDGRLPEGPDPDDDRIIRLVVGGSTGAGQL
jgi:glucose/arabinose dehydrogenase